MEILLIIVAIGLIWHSYKLYKTDLDNKRLNELYQKRFGEQERVERLKEEKPDNVVFQTEILASDLHLTYIGNLDKLNKRQPKNGDIASRNGNIYLYRDGKWYEIINDLPPRIDCTFRY